MSSFQINRHHSETCGADGKDCETLTNFRQAVADSTDLQEKIRGGADLVALGKENGYEFTQEELNEGWKQLQESEEGLTEFELEVVSGGQASSKRS